jgi:hypothetical protein
MYISDGIRNRACQTYRAPALEKDGFLAAAWRVAKCTDGLSRLVFVCSEEIVEALVTDGRHEPLSECSQRCCVSSNAELEEGKDVKRMD